MRDRKIFLILIFTVLFAFVVILWYFFGSKKTSNPSIATPTNPFGNTESRPGSDFVRPFTSSAVTDQTETERTPASERTLIQIWNRPVAGYAFITREIMVEGTSTPTIGTSTPAKLSKPFKKTLEYLMFVDRTTGNIYGYNKDSAFPFPITNTTVPGIYDAYIIQNGTKVLMRYLDQDTGDIKTIIATVPYFTEGSDPHSLTDTKSLQDNVSSIAVSKSSNSYSYIVPSYYGSSIYTVNQKGQTSSVTSPLREWALNYGGEVPYITNKPTAYLEGSTFSLPINNYVLGGKTGLIDLPNETGGLIFASMWSTSGLTTFVSSKKADNLQVLDVKTLASKCSWMDASRIICGVPSSVTAGNEGLPDDWFQGSVSFSDNLSVIDAESGSAYNLFNLSGESGSPFDITRPLVDASNSFFAFTNKQGGSLWMVNLNRVSPQ